MSLVIEMPDPMMLMNIPFGTCFQVGEKLYHYNFPTSTDPTQKEEAKCFCFTTGMNELIVKDKFIIPVNVTVKVRYKE
jgi:hypothetical protein